MRNRSFGWLLAFASVGSLTLFSACNDSKVAPPSDACESKADCPDDYECKEGVCVAPTPPPTDPVCGDGFLHDSEECDTGIAAGQPGACPTECPPQNACRPGKIFGDACEATCGYGDTITVDVDGDGCCPNGSDWSTDSDCTETCGNGEVDEGEICDDGHELNGKPNQCAWDCLGRTEPVCGNAIEEDGEACDTGNESTTCNANCTESECGDGIWNYSAGEQCDDGEQTATCNADCTISTCGDGIVNELAGETCDDGDDNGTALKCNTTCDGTTPAFCGNGVEEEGETCDDGGDNGQPNKCNATCSGTTDAVCGNGVEEEGETCDDGEDNGEPLHCNETCDGETAAVCGNGIEEAGEICDEGADNGKPLHCNATCSGTTGSECGNNVIEPGEECDGGSTHSATCNANCTEPACGDGIHNAAAGEACDDGPANGQPLKCNLTCSGTTTPSCGNGVTEAGESCDDGPENGQPNKCNTSCNGTTGSQCGNGVVEMGEACDDGGDSATCTANCTASSCGDSYVNAAAGETCDAGADNGKPNKCNATCNGTTAPVCGNGVQEANEFCDAGADNGKPNKCNADCSAITTPVCGNSVIEANETCDDGADNGKPNKCNATCNGTTAAVCGNGVKEGNEFCDAGADNGQPLKCNTDCTAITTPVCGNSVKEPGEACDGGSTHTASCNANCTIPACGDGITNPAFGEDCDDSGESATCNADCSTSSCGDGVHNPTAGEACDEGGVTATCDAQCQIPVAQPDVFRIDTARIIDPHLFFRSIPIITSCDDVTNGPHAGQLPNGVNGMLADAFNADDESDPSFFNLSIALLMHPLNQNPTATNLEMSIEFPNCKKDLSECIQDLTQSSISAGAQNIPTGACLPASQQPGREASYTGLNNPIGDCFVTEAVDVTLNIGDISLSLSDAKLVGKYVGTPATAISEGILMGFLPKTVADNTTIPVPVLGDRKISQFLRGGGACKSGSDLDTHNGVSGWWFYLNYTAKKVGTWTPAP